MAYAGLSAAMHIRIDSGWISQRRCGICNGFTPWIGAELPPAAGMPFDLAAPVARKAIDRDRRELAGIAPDLAAAAGNGRAMPLSSSAPFGTTRSPTPPRYAERVRPRRRRKQPG